MATDKSSDHHHSVDRLIAEWFQLVGTGQEPEPSQFIDKYPQYRGQLERFFAEYRLVREQVMIDSQDADERTDTSPVSLPTLNMSQAAESTSVTVTTRYLDLQCYRQGGLGILYAAVDESLHRESVVKFLIEKGPKAAEQRRQFRVEAEITARLDHPGVVPVYGIGEDAKGQPFYVMRLVKGRELAQAIHDYHALPVGASRRRELFNLLEHLVGACNTVAYAHDVGIVHCDLKPANIMIGKYGETLVLDWGLAQPFERNSMFQRSEPTMRPQSAPDSTSSGNRGGTLGYISPEQVDGSASIGPASDVYSLGATLYHILTGHPPFNGRSWNVIEQIRAGTFVRPRDIYKNISNRLEAICLKAMSLDPHARYLTAKQMASDLNNWMRDEEVQAQPDRWYEKIARYSRRHRGLTAGALISAMLFVGGVSLALRMQTIEQDERIVQTILGTTLDMFEDLCHPLASGEMSQLAVFTPFAKKIEDFTNDYLSKYEKKATMDSLTGRVYELRAITHRLNSSETTKALKDYDEAERYYRKHSVNSTSAINIPRRLAQIELSKGEISLQRKEYKEAHDVLTAAETNFLQLLKGSEDNPTLRRELAEVYHCRGEVFFNEDNLNESLNYFKKSRDLREKLIRDADEKQWNSHARDLARSYGYLGDSYLGQGKITDAIKNYQLSLELREELFNANKSDPEYRFQYARGISNFAYYQRDYGGDVNRAIKDFERARKLQQSLCEQFVDVTRFKMDLASSLTPLAELYLLRSILNSETSPDDQRKLEGCLQDAKDIYGELSRVDTPAMIEQGRFGLAFCYLTEAMMKQQGAPERSRNLIQKAAAQLEQYEPETVRRENLITLAMQKSLEGDPETALNVVKRALSKGENGVFRIESQLLAGLRGIAENTKMKQELEEECTGLREKLKLPRQ